MIDESDGRLIRIGSQWLIGFRSPGPIERPAAMTERVLLSLREFDVATIYVAGQPVVEIPLPHADETLSVNLSARPIASRTSANDRRASRPARADRDRRLRRRLLLARYIRQFPVDILKVDKSFIDRIDEGDEELALAAAIIDMAKVLNLRPVAEGVERVEQLERLLELGCDSAQGYYFAKPGSQADVESHISGEIAPDAVAV